MKRWLAFVVLALALTSCAEPVTDYSQDEVAQANKEAAKPSAEPAPTVEPTPVTMTNEQARRAVLLWASKMPEELDRTAKLALELSKTSNQYQATGDPGPEQSFLVAGRAYCTFRLGKEQKRLAQVPTLPWPVHVATEGEKIVNDSKRLVALLLECKSAKTGIELLSTTDALGRFEQEQAQHGIDYPLLLARLM